MRARLVPVLVAMTVAAGGCTSGEPEVAPAPLPRVSDSPSPTATPTAAAVAAPPEANEATPEGAAEFGRFFYETIDRSFRERNAGDLAAISSPACEVCQRYISSIKGLAARNERVEGNDITVKDTAAPGEAGVRATATVIYDNSPGRVLDAEGAVVLEEPGRENVVVELVLTRSAESWLVEEVRSG